MCSRLQNVRPQFEKKCYFGTLTIEVLVVLQQLHLKYLTKSRQEGLFILPTNPVQLNVFQVQDLEVLNYL